MIDQVAIILVSYRDYAERYLAGCIESLRKVTFGGSFKIFIVDNASTPETAELIRKIAPEAELLTNPTNDGFGKGNNDGIKKALTEGFTYFVLLNLDVEVEPNFLSELVKAAEAAENWGAVQSRLMLFADKTKVNSLGNSLHYLGFGFSNGAGQKLLAKSYSPRFAGEAGELSAITYFSGAAVLLRKEVLDQVGLFDEEFWMYHDDLELSWRIRLAGYQVYLAPESVVYHKYQFARSIKNYYWMERNRFIWLLTDYRIWTLLLILPMLILMEVGLFLFALKGGWWREKLRVYGWFLNPVNWSYLSARRCQIKRLRKVEDRGLVKYFSSEIQFQEVDNKLLRWVGNPMMKLYWLAIRRII